MENIQLFYTYSKHLEMKSINNGSLHLKTIARFLEPGFLFLPLEFVIHLGLPLESENPIIHN